MRDERGNITIKSIYKWLKSSKGKKYSFVVFYIIFFIFLFIFMTSLNSNDKDNDIKDFSLPFKTSNFESNNYNFEYISNINLEETLYEGIKSDNKISLRNLDDVFDYEYQNGKLVNLEDNPIKYLDFLDIYELKRIIENSTLISETKFSNTKEYEYDYEISNEKLGEILEVNTNYEDINKIIVVVSDDLLVKTIKLDVLNFIKEVENDNYNSYLITIKYGDNYE